jgi:hypothetical protein
VAAGGVLCVLCSFLFSFLPSLGLRCAGSPDCRGVLEYRPIRGPCMVLYIATLRVGPMIMKNSFSKNLLLNTVFYWPYNA